MHHNCIVTTLTAIHPSCKSRKHSHSERAGSGGGCGGDGVSEPSYPLIQGKWLNIQTSDSTHIYHKQLHGIRTSFSSSVLAQCQVLLRGRQSQCRKVYLQIIFATWLGGGRSFSRWQQRKPPQCRTKMPQLTKGATQWGRRHSPFALTWSSS